MIILLSSVVVTVTWLLGSHVVVADDKNVAPDLFQFSVLQDVHLPKPISDFTATLDTSNEMAYLAGGCDSAVGNEWNGTSKQYECNSISDALYSFDVKSNTFKELAKLPIKRYRHGAAFVNNQLWLMGGRDDKEVLVATVDVYSIADDKWTSYNISEKYWRSDNGGFSDGSKAYFVGGYDTNYNFLDSFFAIDPVSTTSSGSLVIEDKAPLIIARGDLMAIASTDHSFAVVTGGFGTVYEFCEPLVQTEIYSFSTDTWRSSGNLTYGRSDMVLLEVLGDVYGMGGERQIVGICDLTPDNQPAVGDETIPVDDVEIYRPELNDWDVLSDMLNHRFRASGIGYDSIKSGYLFGGQNTFDSTCQCFRTTDEIVLMSPRPATVSAAPKATSGTSIAFSASCVLGIAFVSLVAFFG